MEDALTRFIEDLVGRLDGPMKFRLVLQPVIAIVAAARNGRKDAKAGKPPYFWALFTDPAHRAEMLRDGWRTIGRVFILGIIMDVIYQIIVFRRFYPVEALVIAAILVLVPYLLVRGPVTHIARGRSKRTTG